MDKQIENDGREAIKYKEEFFITPYGEVLQFAATVDESLANDKKTYISEFQIKSTEESKSVFKFKVVLLHCRT